MRFCFIPFGALLAAAVAGAAGPNASPSTVTSIVRLDGRTGRLIRTVVRPAYAGATRPKDPAVRSLIDETAKRHEVDPLLVHSVIEVESNFNAFAVSPKGAEGLMQLIPSTARRFGVRNSFNSRENVSGGVRYLRHLLDLFKDDRLALAAYNAGERAVLRHGGVPPYPETQNYVRLVSARYDAARRAAALEPRPEPATETAAAGEAYAPLEFFIDARGTWHLRTRTP